MEDILICYCFLLVSYINDNDADNDDDDDDDDDDGGGIDSGSENDGEDNAYKDNSGNINAVMIIMMVIFGLVDEMSHMQLVPCTMTILPGVLQTDSQAQQPQYKPLIRLLIFC